MRGIGVIGGDGQGFAEYLLCAVPVIVTQFIPGLSGTDLRKVRLELQCRLHRLARAAFNHVTIDRRRILRQQHVAIGKAGPPQREIRIQFDNYLEILDGGL